VRTVIDIENETRRLDSEKPSSELIDGVEVQKEAPMTRHTLLQAAMSRLIGDWAGRRGYVGPEFRIWLNVDSDRPTTLVPDVAYVRSERLEALPVDEQQRPQIAPDLVVELRSPGDRERNVRRKIELYLAYGCPLVLDVDPEARTIVAHDGMSVRTYRSGDSFAHGALPGFAFDVAAFFADGEVRSRGSSQAPTR